MMWSFEELQTHRHWMSNDIPPAIRAFIPEPDLACLADDGELDRGLALHLLHEAIFDWPAPDTPAWVQAAIAANPGVWISRLCRAKHGLGENLRSIAYCGQCAGGYANPRRRKRAAALQKEVLPGFEQIGGAYQLHEPCSRRDLTWLRQLIYRLVRQGRVIKVREKRPDLRQPRGWDWMSCLYPTEKGVIPDEP
jgi:hypothetical protein